MLENSVDISIHIRKLAWLSIIIEKRSTNNKIVRLFKKTF